MKRKIFILTAPITLAIIQLIGVLSRPISVSGVHIPNPFIGFDNLLLIILSQISKHVELFLIFSYFYFFIYLIFIKRKNFQNDASKPFSMGAILTVSALINGLFIFVTFLDLEKHALLAIHGGSFYFEGMMASIFSFFMFVLGLIFFIVAGVRGAIRKLRNQNSEKNA